MPCSTVTPVSEVRHCPKFRSPSTSAFRDVTPSTFLVSGWPEPPKIPHPHRSLFSATSFKGLELMPGCGKTSSKSDARAQGCRWKASEDQTSPGISLVGKADLRSPRQWVEISEEAASNPCNHGSDTLYFVSGTTALNLVCACLEVLRCSRGLFQECFVLFSFYCSFFSLSETSSVYVVQLTSYSRSSCFNVLSVGILCIHHHTQLQEWLLLALA